MRSLSGFGECKHLMRKLEREGVESLSPKELMKLQVCRPLHSFRYLKCVRILGGCYDPDTVKQAIMTAVATLLGAGTTALLFLLWGCP